jgi:hypothetical protein
MLADNRKFPKYDLPTAVTFLFAGLGVGWAMALLFANRTESSAVRPRPASEPQTIADEVFLG